MQIIVNSKPTDITVTSLAAAMVELGFLDCAVATALNGQFVPKGMRESVELSQGDRLEVLAPMQGG